MGIFKAKNKVTERGIRWMLTGWLLAVAALYPKDADAQTAQTDSVAAPRDGKRAGRVLSTLLLGRTYATEDGRWEAHVGGATSFVADYNFVDGFWVGASAEGSVRLGRQTRLTFAPALYYLTARNGVAGSGTLTLDYLPRRQGSLRLEGGMRSADYNGENGEARRINVIASALFGKSVIHYYEKQYLTAANRLELADGLLLELQLTWERREMLENRSGGWFTDDVEPNVPAGESYRMMPVHEVLKGTAELEYTPGSRYRMIDGRKVYEPATWPTFGLRYDRALPWRGTEVKPEFDRLELTVEQTCRLRKDNELDWALSGGLFLHKKDLQFPDYKHFATTRFPMTENLFDIGFSRADNYMYATDGRWLQAHASWYTPHLLLTRLPLLRDTDLNEALHARTVVIGGKTPYWETGYSIGLKKLVRIGVFAGFEGGNYRSAGVALSLPLSYMAELSKML